jgi:hypothetical protein
MKNFCKCSCHISPLFYHIGKCCENSGKIYLNSSSEVIPEKFNEIMIEKYKDICPCCAGTGRLDANK